MTALEKPTKTASSTMFCMVPNTVLPRVAGARASEALFTGLSIQGARGSPFLRITAHHFPIYAQS